MKTCTAPLPAVVAPLLQSASHARLTSNYHDSGVFNFTSSLSGTQLAGENAVTVTLPLNGDYVAGKVRCGRAARVRCT